MRIAILVPGLAPYDAVSNDALAMTLALREDGHEVAVFAPHARDVAEPALDPRALETWLRGPDDVVVYHCCTGWDFAVELLARVRARRVVRYHNITPPEFFEDYSDAYVAACADGRRQLDAIAALGCELHLGCSPFNNEDFLARGVDHARCVVLAPFHRTEELLKTPADERRIGDGDGATRLLMVGRISPNKGDFDLVDTLAASRVAFDVRSVLIRVGKLDPTLAAYGDALAAHIAMRGVGDAIVNLSDASAGELRAAYAAADALVLMSRHEGFCVPLIEAMALGTPIVAYASSAIGWTLGDAGILWDRADPHLFAASVARLLSDAELRESLRSRARDRYRSLFAPDVLRVRLRAAFDRLARTASAGARA